MLLYFDCHYSQYDSSHIHPLDRTVHVSGENMYIVFILSSRLSVGFFEGEDKKEEDDRRKVDDDLENKRPTIDRSVPSLFQSINGERRLLTVSPKSVTK